MIDLFAYTVPTKDDTKETLIEKNYLLKEISILDEEVFEGIDFYYFLFIKEASKMNVLLNEKMMTELMSFLLKGFVNRHRVHTETSLEFSFNDYSGFESAVKSIALELMEYHKILSTSLIKVEDFKSNLIALRNDVEKKFLTKVLIKASDMIESPEEKKVGASETGEYVKIKMMQLDEISRKFNDILTDSTTKAKPERLCAFGVKEIDENSGGVYTTEILSIEGPPGYGKTTITLLNPVYQAIKAGKNVLYLSVEQTEEKLKSMLLSRFLYEVYGPNHILTSNDIMDEIYAQDATLKTKVEVAKHKLFNINNSIYGKFIAPSTEELYTNTIISEVERHEAKHHIKFDMVVIDYMYNLEHKRIDRETLNLADKMKEGYRQAKSLALHKGKAVIVLNQLTDSGIEAVANGTLLRAGQIAGGHAATHYTSEDYVIGGTEADIQNSIITLQNMKMRNTGKLPRIPYKFNPIVGTLVSTLE